MVFYSKMNDLCYPNTIALTSNKKFLSPLDSVYWKNWIPVYSLNKKNITEYINKNCANK